MIKNNKANMKVSWESTLLPLGSTIEAAINSLEFTGMQIVLAISEDRKLAGTLTDGDIRRALLRGAGLGAKIDDWINRNPLVVTNEINYSIIMQLMQINKIHQLPILDKNGAIIGLHVWDSIISPNKIENLMVIMAGGRGTRLYPHTKNCPKPMLEVAGKPILQHIIEGAINEGFNNFAISINYLGEMIENYFNDGSRFGVNIQYIKEKTPMGTAGSLSLLSKINDLPIVVTNGDVVTRISYKEMINYHTQQMADATMAIRHYQIQNQFGVVITQGNNIERFEEKPIYKSNINAGIYALNSDCLKLILENEVCDMPEVFNRVKKNNGHAIAYPIHEKWTDIGHPTDLINLKKSYESSLGNN